MAPNVGNSLQLLLFGYFFSLLLLLLEFEALRGRLKLLLVHDKEVAGPSLTKVRLRQNVLHTSDRADIALIVDILQLVSLIGLVDDSVSLFKVDQFACLLSRVTVEEATQGLRRIGRRATCFRWCLFIGSLSSSGIVGHSCS